MSRYLGLIFVQVVVKERYELGVSEPSFPEDVGVSLPPGRHTAGDKRPGYSAITGEMQWFQG